MTQQNDLGAIQVSGQTDILPCPFCGNELYRSPRVHNPKAYCVTEECYGKRMSVVNLDDPIIVAMWNARAALRRPAPTEPDIRAALEDVLAANKDFRAGMPKDWEGDPLQDACDAAGRVLAALSPAGDTGDQNKTLAGLAASDVFKALENLSFHATAACVPNVDEMQLGLTRMSIDRAEAIVARVRDAEIADRAAGDTGREPVAWQFQALSGAWNDCGDPDPRYVAKNPHRYRALYASAQPDARIGREEIARIVYDAFPFEPRLGTPHKPAWLPGGNSLMQDEARKAADAILALTARDAGSDVTVPRAHGKTGDARS